MRRPVHPTLLALSTIFVGGAAAGMAARADVIELATGGQLQGKIVQSTDEDKNNFTIDLAVGGQLTLPRSQVARVNTSSEADAEYKKLARTSPDTAQAHWKLAEWCRQHKLQADYQRHLERVLELDPNHKDARAALGFREKDGQWLSRNDVMASRGLVMYEGRYVTPQHVEVFEQQKKNKANQSDWSNRIERLRRFLTGRRQDRAAEARAEILAINDPEAADAVVAALRREKDRELTRLWIEVASHLNSRVAIDALVDLSLNDPDEEIRHLCIDNLVRSARPGLATPFIRALNNKDNEIVNRAAVALGQIRDRDSLGPLIDALITNHKVKIGSGNPDQHAYTFSPDGGSGAFSFGGSAPKIVNQPVRNAAVLETLTSMSGGANFDYDQERWHSWLAAQAKVNAVDVRRDQ